MDDVVGFLRSSGLVKALGLLLVGLLGFNLVEAGNGTLVFWVLVATTITAAGVWGVRTTSSGARLACAALASYAIGIVWLVYKCPAAVVVWATIASLVARAGIASYRSKSGPARAVCILMAVTLPQAFFVALLEQSNWTM